MKKKIFLGAIIFFVLISLIASKIFAVSFFKKEDVKNSSVFEANSSVNLKDEVVKGNGFVLARDSVIENETIDGDLFICAQNVEIKENATINGNVFIAGSTIKIDGKIERELYVAGADVTIGENTVVGYNACIAAENLKISGTFERDINAGVTKMEVAENTTISGNLNYSSAQEADINDKASIGKVNFSKQTEPEHTVWDVVLEHVLDFVRYFVITMVVLIILIKKAPKFIEKAGKQVQIASFGAGILGLILVPIIFVVLLALSVTSTIAWAILIAFILALILSMAVTNIAVAKLIENKKENIKLPIWTSLVIALSWIIYQIPVIGAVVAFIWVMIGFGIILRNFFGNAKAE